MGIVEQLSYRVDLWLGHRVTVGSGDTSRESFILIHWIGLIFSLWWFDELTVILEDIHITINWRCFT
jgi:hypothetical protein